MNEFGVSCRSSCGACCTAPSISSPIPGMPHGKPAGLPCIQLLPDARCALFGKPERPAVCISLRPTNTMCRSSREEALAGLLELERATMPDVTSPAVSVIDAVLRCAVEGSRDDCSQLTSS